MEKITMVNINNKDYKLTESAYLLLSDYNDYIKKTIQEKEKILDIEIQISVIIDMEIENKGEEPVVDIEIIKEVIKVLKENQKIYYQPGRSRSKKAYKKTQRKHRKFNKETDLRRDKRNAVLAGVCAGLGNKFGIDPVIFRIIFVAGFFLSALIPFFLIYIIMWIVIPEED